MTIRPRNCVQGRLSLRERPRSGGRARSRSPQWPGVLSGRQDPVRQQLGLDRPCYRHDVAADGTLTNGRVFADLTSKIDGLADGMKIDAKEPATPPVLAASGFCRRPARISARSNRRRRQATARGATTARRVHDGGAQRLSRQNAGGPVDESPALSRMRRRRRCDGEPRPQRLRPWPESGPVAGDSRLPDGTAYAAGNSR